jgi:hypothetical protein
MGWAYATMLQFEPPQYVPGSGVVNYTMPPPAGGPVSRAVDWGVFTQDWKEGVGVKLLIDSLADPAWWPDVVGGAAPGTTSEVSPPAAPGG